MATEKTRNPGRRPRSLAGNETGMALIYVIYVVMAVGLFITAAVAVFGNSIHRARIELTFNGQAANVARAGLADAVNWFKVQATQPVRSNGTSYTFPDQAFDPQSDPDPKKNYTDDPTVGLVKDFAITDASGLWGHYEIRKQVANNYVTPAQEDTTAVHDVSSRLGKGNAGDGVAWYIQATGTVYQLRDDTKAYNVAPNRVVSRIKMAQEILSLSLKRPAESAIIVGTASNISIGTNGRVTGMPNGYAVTYHTGTGTPSPSPAPASATGSPSAYVSLPDASWFDDVQSVFSVSQSELRSLASVNVSSVAGLPSPLPDMAIIYIEGNATFTPTRPLTGGGILFVNGDLTLQANSNSLFSGMIYVTGRVYQYAPSLISGMVIAHGGYTISGTNDVAQVEYSPSVLSTVRNQLCQYQEAKAPYVVP